MGRPERPLDVSDSPVFYFAKDLRKLRADSGNPTYRDMARIALFSPSMLSSAASGHRLPTLQVTLAFVTACDGNRVEWERRWQKLAAQLDQGSKRAKTTPDAPGISLVRPAQLPAGPGHFVGRRAELAAARLAIFSAPDEARLPLTICGPFGVGKTAFALRFAHDLAPHFPDGQLYADMGEAGGPSGRPPSDVAGGFLGALGVPAGEIPAGDLDRIGLFRSMVARRRLLVVLDGVVDESQVTPFLTRSMTSTVLITSRARLLGLDGVRRIDLDVFSRSESMELIGRLVGDERLRTDREAIFRLGEVCDDLPLAVSIAGRKIASQAGRSLSEIVRQLADEAYRINWLRVGDVSLRNVLALTYLRLPDRAREVFHQVVRCGGEGACAVDIARSMTIDAASAECQLEELVDCGLLGQAPGSTRYVMSTLTEAFGRRPPRLGSAPPARDERAATCACRTLTVDDELIPIHDGVRVRS